MARRQCWKPGPHPGGRKGKGSKGARDEGKGLLFERVNRQRKQSGFEDRTQEHAYLGNQRPERTNRRSRTGWTESSLQNKVTLVRTAGSKEIYIYIYVNLSIKVFLKTAKELRRQKRKIN